MEEISPFINPDKYGKTTIKNIYFDTENYLLIRRSIDKPIFKEKLRIRAYGDTTPEGTVFIEIKRKFNSVVYKRRIALPKKEALAYFQNRGSIKDTQIAREIDYFVKFYGGLLPAVFLSYDREAYYSVDSNDFRITFDKNILARQSDFSLCSPAYGEAVLPQEKVLMEIKCSGGIPLWMTNVLSRHKIYKTSFSKYGTVYQNRLCNPNYNPNNIKNADNKCFIGVK